ncbi:hypothetical protein V140_02648, partial [Staphylococcus aureus DICM09/01587-13HST]
MKYKKQNTLKGGFIIMEEVVKINGLQK